MDLIRYSNILCIGSLLAKTQYTILWSQEPGMEIFGLMVDQNYFFFFFFNLNNKRFFIKKNL